MRHEQGPRPAVEREMLRHYPVDAQGPLEVVSHQ